MPAVAPPNCAFVLNKQPISSLVCGGVSYPASSGLGRDVNDPAKANDADAGPIPPGRYNIVDRPVGGRFPMIESTIHDLISHSQRTEWFALYSTSSNADHMTVQKIKRGNVRLHPIGRLGISEGCITLMHQDGFDQLRTTLLATPKTFIPGTQIRTYGTVEVR